MRVSANRIRRLAVATVLAAPLCGAAVASADTRQPLRTVTYRGYSVTVPRSWPVYRLASAPRTCVRFNRHAVYLGVPGAEQQCPPQAVGRTEAILIEPDRFGRAADGTGAALPVEGAATTFVVPSAGVRVIATWLHDPRMIARALHRRTLPAPAASADRAAPRIRTQGSGGGSTGPGADVYVGPGFDMCDVPSTQQMSAWATHSPYHAIGVYIGGANAACPPSSDPNLNTTWLSTEAAAGWHFIPTYVGLQAPSGCCQGMSTNTAQAAAQGTAAADDAVTQAQSLALGPGTPIYDDMEYYARTSTNTPAVLAFLGAWTTELHAKGYLSGVYGNADSAIADLVTQAGTSYPEPDDIWFAAWPGNGSQSTTDPSIPSNDWVNNQRLHQYSGGHNETYGGVTLNIDDDYLDAATVGATTALPPSLAIAPAGGQTNLTATWSGLGLARWEILAGTSPTTTSGIKSVPLQGAQTTMSVKSAAPYFAVEALGSTNQVLAVSTPVAAPPRLEIFGHSSFVGESSKVGTVPVGCYLTTACQLVAQVYWGGTRIARSAPTAFRPGGSGIVYYRLNWAGLRLLTKYHDVRLPVHAVVTDVTGASTTSSMSLIPFATSGPSPARGLGPSSTIGAAGTTNFVHGWSGGVLVRCNTVSACWSSATLSAGRTKIASTGAQPIGGMEVGYVFFALTGQGHQLLSQQRGNQLGANLTLRSGTSSATARLSLVRF